jgi:hypothetical protein
MVLRLARAKLKQRIQRIVPFSMRFYLMRQERAHVNARMRKHRQDMVDFPLGEGAYLQVYWKIYGVGRGPALALYISDEEVLKFDFYGAEKAHYHVQLMQPAPRRYSALLLREKSVPEQIDRAIFELENNLYWYLERHPFASVRQFRVRKSTLKSVLSEIKPLLISYLDRVPSEEPSQLSA